MFVNKRLTSLSSPYALFNGTRFSQWEIFLNHFTLENFLLLKNKFKFNMIPALEIFQDEFKPLNHEETTFLQLSLHFGILFFASKPNPSLLYSFLK